MIDLDQLLSRLAERSLTLRTFAEQAGAAFHGSGPKLCSACPLHHGDNPTAFHIYAGGARWHCFTRCPDGQNDGDLITFYMRWKSLDFPSAVRELAVLAGLSSPSKLKSLPTMAIPADFIDTLDRIIHTPFMSSLPAAASITQPVLVPSPAWQARAQACLDYTRRQLHHPKTGAPARAYLFSERGLNPHTQEVFQLGYNPSDLFDEAASWGLDQKVSANRKVFIPRGIVIPGFSDADGCSAGAPWYLKIRRPLPGDLLGEYLPVHEKEHGKGDRPQAKYLSVLGSRPSLFGCGLFLGHPALLLTEGEFDCMLAWQIASDLCDVATLGSASSRASLPELACLTRYRQILAVYDSDPAGDQGRAYLASLISPSPSGEGQGVRSRIQIIPPPDHDLTDYWRSGRNLRAWLASFI